MQKKVTCKFVETMRLIMVKTSISSFKFFRANGKGST